MTFINPVKYGHLTNETTKQYTYTSEFSDSIVAPFDGLINDVRHDKCDGFIQISHLIKNEVIYSNICGANKTIYVSTGMNVRKGDVIAVCGNSQVTYEIKNSNNEKLPIPPFFDKNNDYKGDEKEKKEPKRDDKKKEEPIKDDKKDNKKNKTKEPKDYSEKKGLDFTDMRIPKEIPNLFQTLLLTPFSVIEKGLKSKKKETKEEEEKLQEELIRIKKLLK
jgi:hypothetical protein